VEAINTGDGETLKEGITDLRGEIQQNQKYAQQLIEELTKLRDSIGHDVRAFGSNKELLQSILKNQGADVDADQKRLEEVLGSVNYYKQLESDGEGYKAFYLPSMTVTCIFFFALFVLSAIMNSIKLSRISVLQLVHADAQTERVAVKGKMTGVVAFLAVILLGMGYASMIYMEKLREMGIIIA
ncbi:HBL/NHE enterotoxin family protein, partial [Bacillus sp. SS-TM]